MRDVHYPMVEPKSAHVESSNKENLVLVFSSQPEDLAPNFYHLGHHII